MDELQEMAKRLTNPVKWDKLGHVIHLVKLLIEH